MNPGDRAGSATAPRPARDRAAALAAAACAAALLLHAYTAARPSLMTDDFTILLGSWTWADTRANLWRPLNEHVSPPTRLTTYAVVELAGRPTNLPFAAAAVSRVGLVAAVLLLYLFVRRERGHPLPALVAAAVFGVTAVYQQAVYWYAAGFVLYALAFTLLALLAARRWRRTGRWRWLAACAGWCAAAPAWFATGILAGPLCGLYLLRGRRWWAAAVPPLGALLFLAATLPKAGEQVLHARHYGSRTAADAFDPRAGLVNAGRSVVDNLLVGSLGLDEAVMKHAFGVQPFVCPPAVVVPVLVLLAGGLAWWWKRAADRHLVLLGVAFVAASYVLMYAARAPWDYALQLRGWSRYHVFPQLGVALVVAGGLRVNTSDYRLSPAQARGVLRLILVLFVVHLPRGLIGSPRWTPDQLDTLRRIEAVDARCREHHVSAADARAVLGAGHVPGSGSENAWDFLRGSPDPRPHTPDEVRRLLDAGR